MAFSTRLFGVFLILSMFMLVAFPKPPISQKKQKPPPPPPPVALPLGGYEMTLFWPPGFCYDLGENCDKDEVSDEAFTAHGLWPLNTNLNTKKKKSGYPFSPNPKVLADELAPHWKTYNKLHGKKNAEVWEHEWDKHGKNGDFSQDAYFKKGIELTERYGKWLVQILKEGGIKPNDGVKYNLVDIEKALVKGLGAMPEIVCKEGKIAGVYVLTEIRVILDISTDNRLNAKSKKCKENLIYFPSSASFSEYISGRHTEL